MVDQIIVAWSRQEVLTEDEHLLDGYFDLKSGEESSIRDPFQGQSYAKVMGGFARLARENPEAKLFAMRLDQEPEPVLMPIDERMSDLLREDPVTYIRVTSPPARKVKLKLEDSPAKPNKITENIHEDLEHGEPWMAPIPGGYDTVVESFGDEVFCRMSGSLVECPACGRWAATKLLEGGDVMVNCASCLFEDAFQVVATPDRTWAAIPTEALLQNEKGNGVRFFIPRAWNKDGPWIKYEALKQRYETFCKERDDAQRAETTRSDDPPGAA